ncbi:MAG: 4Fe-4S dicluster domain-containing protein [Spirochaetales bacterium]|nr:4Fe-4S dicluster domain-containing protein [Spirochaetales bacterium]
MKTGILTKPEIQELFSSMITKNGEESRIFVPATIEGRVILEEFSPEREIFYDFANFLRPPKGIFFPQREVLCSFEQERAVEVPPAAGRIIIFGIRPCDARSFLFLDKIFSAGSSGFADPYYLGRRENSVIISLSCIEPSEGCFCTSLGGGPGDESGSDIVAFDLGDRLLFEAHSAKGENFIEENTTEFRQPDAADQNAKKESLQAAFNAISRISTDGLVEKLDDDFSDSFWEEITATCLGCGVCTYLCPTCHCFDITDEKDRDGTGTRVRTWDSCQYPLFTMHASGHNPRAEKKQRMRQRIMHKFSYTPRTTGDVFCVGCGRCVRKCPVNLDIREVIRKINGE